MVKNLRIENEYFQRQLDSLRKEVEAARAHAHSSEKPMARTRSLDRNSLSRERENGLFLASGDAGSGRANYYEPQMHLP